MRPAASGQTRTFRLNPAYLVRLWRRRASAMRVCTCAAYHPHLLPLPACPLPLPPLPLRPPSPNPSGPPGPLLFVDMSGAASGGLSSGFGSSCATGVCSTIFSTFGSGGCGGGGGGGGGGGKLTIVISDRKSGVE